MKEYRITKYNPRYRGNGVYLRNEWTSISDIGKEFADGVLSATDYSIVENRYVLCCLELARAAGVTCLSVVHPEVYNKKVALPREIYDEDQLSMIVRQCLQELCWANLEAQNFFIHFGYDYYMYIGTVLPVSVVQKIASQNCLFCERIE